MAWGRKIWWIPVVLLTSAVLVVGAAWWLVVRRPLPQLDGVLEVPGLASPVEVWRDAWGVPHIQAENEKDLLLAQGYVQAQDRLWQMEMNRRLAAGRLSEIMGPKALTSDRWALTMGFHEAAQRELESYDDFHRELLQAYSRGVNACLEAGRGRLPLEFRLSGCQPEPWQPVDSLAWAKVAAYSGGRNWQEEVVRALLVGRLGEDRAADLLGHDRAGTPLILSAAFGLRPDMAFEARNWQQPPLGGSNAWIVHGSRTLRGLPLLANDLHLPVQVPSSWYEIHLSDDGLDVAGLALVGFPLVFVGHNQHLAWGAALANVDDQDIFYEKMNPRQQGEYLFQDHWLKAEHLTMEIKVKGEKPVSHEIWITRHGPLINPVAPRLRLLRQAMALKWAGREPGELLPALRLLNLAESRDDLEDAAGRWCEPALSLVYGDREGHIGYILAGRVPTRAGGDAPGPYPGWSGEYEWTGYLDPADKPVLRDPDQGFIVAANNRLTRAGRLPYLGQDYDPGFRAARIDEVLAKNDQVTMDDCRELQMDITCQVSRDFLAALQNIDPSRLLDRRGYDLLSGWDLKMASDSAGAALFAVLIRCLMENTFRDELGDAADLFFGASWCPSEGPNLFTGHSLVILDRLMEEPDGIWFDDIRTKEREGLLEVMTKSLDQATALVAEKLGQDTSRWAWGRLHQISFRHPLAGTRPGTGWLSLGPFPGQGYNLTVMQSMVAESGGFELRGATAASRHLYTPEDWDLCQGGIVPGQSGLFGSPHYQDQVEPWLRGQGHAMPFSSQGVKEQSRHHLTLKPGDS